jgi:hypothetical protein
MLTLCLVGLEIHPPRNGLNEIANVFRIQFQKQDANKEAARE